MARRKAPNGVVAAAEAERQFVVPEGKRPMEVVLEEFWRWLATGACKIRSKRGGALIALRPNKSQRRIFKVMYEQARAGEPVRVLILKPRQHGASTFIQAFIYFFVKFVPHVHALTVAHADDSTREIFGILRGIYEHDPGRLDEVKAANRKELVYGHGSRAALATAGGRYIASGMTLQALNESELSKWEGDVEDQCASIENALTDDPLSFHAIDSTSNRADTSGVFEERWRRATAGKLGGFRAVFVSWLDVEEYSRPVPAGGLGELLDYEREYMERHGATAEQISWYRFKLGSRSRQLMMQEFPTTPEEAFQVAKGRIYPMLRDERHNVRIEDLRGWRLYRGIDWGGSHPFVCLWVAARDGVGTGLTVDKFACPELWRSMAGWCWDSGGRRPEEKYKDCNDALRYVIGHYCLTGRVHVFRELVVEDSGQKGLSEADLANEVLSLSAGEQYRGTVADRSRPNSIVLFNKMGVSTVAKAVPRTTAIGEIEDEIAMVHTLLVGSVDLAQRVPPPPSFWDTLRKARSWGSRVGVKIGTLAQDVVDVRSQNGVGCSGHPFLGRARRGMRRTN